MAFPRSAWECIQNKLYFIFYIKIKKLTETKIHLIH